MYSFLSNPVGNQFGWGWDGSSAPDKRRGNPLLAYYIGIDFGTSGARATAINGRLTVFIVSVIFLSCDWLPPEIASFLEKGCVAVDEALIASCFGP